MFGDDSDKNLSAWRAFRHAFDGNVEECVHAFSSIPVQTRYIDYYTPATWPGAFEIVADNMMCQSGITLVMAATLCDLEFINAEELEFQVVSNHITGTEGLVLKHNDQVYNFLPSKIVDEEFCKNNSTQYESYIIAVDKLT